jgi:hypothetical protein
MTINGSLSPEILRDSRTAGGFKIGSIGEVYRKYPYKKSKIRYSQKFAERFPSKYY